MRRPCGSCCAVVCIYTQLMWQICKTWQDMARTMQDMDPEAALKFCSRLASRWNSWMMMMMMMMTDADLPESDLAEISCDEEGWNLDNADSFTHSTLPHKGVHPQTRYDYKFFLIIWNNPEPLSMKLGEMWSNWTCYEQRNQGLCYIALLINVHSAVLLLLQRSATALLHSW